MNKQKSGWLSLVFASILLVSLLAACGDGGDNSDASGELSGEITVFAAASLTDAFNEIKENIEAENDGVTVAFNFAGSQALATQLAEGAGADVFASANQTQMTAARDADRIDGEPEIFTRNRLAIIVPSDNPAGINTPPDLASPGILLVVAADAVPVGRYTLEMLDNMSADPEYGEGFRAEVEANFVSHEDNVRQVVSKVALGEADAGVVYVSDITSDLADDVTIVAIPDDVNVIVEYPIVRVQDGNTALADLFIDYILSDAGQAVLQEYGFAELP